MLESNLCREHERAVWGVGKKKEREKEKGREEEGQKGEGAGREGSYHF